MNQINSTDNEDRPLEEMTTSELQALKFELNKEKAENIQRIAELNAILKNTPISDRGTRKNREHIDERAELVADNSQIDTDMQAITALIKQRDGNKEREVKVTHHIVTLVSARIASGDSRPIHEITLNAIADLKTITETVMTSIHE